MNVFSIRMEPFGGSSIADCAVAASRVANLLGVVVMFNFNSVDCMIRPGDDPSGLPEKYDAVLMSKSSYKMASV